MGFRKADESLVQTKLDSFFKPVLLRSKTSTISEASYRGLNALSFIGYK
jgi:hypothetical protein